MKTYKIYETMNSNTEFLITKGDFEPFGYTSNDLFNNHCVNNICSYKYPRLLNIENHYDIDESILDFKKIDESINSRQFYLLEKSLDDINKKIFKFSFLMYSIKKPHDHYVIKLKNCKLYEPLYELPYLFVSKNNYTNGNDLRFNTIRNILEEKIQELYSPCIVNNLKSVQLEFNLTYGIVQNFTYDCILLNNFCCDDQKFDYDFFNNIKNIYDNKQIFTNNTIIGKDNNQILFKNKATLGF